ncbi:MAG: hypothetical protein KJ687_05400, partial [Proteobacteria bacterium]|nr:hypothetical protein [Pseudomonadota bacterium]
MKKLNTQTRKGVFSPFYPPVVAKRTCPPVPCGGNLSAFGGSRFIGDTKLSAFQMRSVSYKRIRFNYGLKHDTQIAHNRLYWIIILHYSITPILQISTNI